MVASLKDAAVSLRYSGRIKTEAIARLGFYSMARAFRKLLKKPLGQEKEEHIKALRDGMRRAKRETESSLTAHFKDYQENIKFQYMFRLADVAGQRLHENLVGHFRDYLSDLRALIKTIGDQRGNKDKMENSLAAVEQAADAIQAKLRQLRSDLDSLHKMN